MVVRQLVWPLGGCSKSLAYKARAIYRLLGGEAIFPPGLGTAGRLSLAEDPNRLLQRPVYFVEFIKTILGTIDTTRRIASLGVCKARQAMVVIEIKMGIVGAR